MARGERSIKSREREPAEGPKGDASGACGATRPGRWRKGVDAGLGPACPAPRLQEHAEPEDQAGPQGPLQEPGDGRAEPGCRAAAGPRRPGPVLKASWLRKQRGIMKNWQPRWFVLRGDQLLYYKDKDETKPQGLISLQGTQVTELPPGPEDPGKHLFEISPGGAGEREKAPAGPEALLLMASSRRDMEDWVQAIRRVIWAPRGGGTARSSRANPVEPSREGIFGQRLEDTVYHERKYGPGWPRCS